jgi:hypothetical protein
MDKELSLGRTGENIKDNGRITTCQAREFSTGLMGEFM